MNIKQYFLNNGYYLSNEEDTYLEFKSVGGSPKSLHYPGTKYAQSFCKDQRIIRINTRGFEKYGFGHIGIKEDGGTRTSFNGIYKSLEDIIKILELAA